MPANLINLEAVGKAYGTVTVLDDVSLGIAEGERIGVVGRNGGGKTTLLRLITGDETPDGGRVTRTTGVHIASVSQRGELPGDASVRDVVVGDAAEHEWAGDAAIREILNGLGLSALGHSAVGLDAPVARLSGGERRRVALSRALVQQAELLVLDEPTNHLDVDAREALVQALNAYEGAIVMVSHDPSMVERVADRLWLVKDGACAPFHGDLQDYRKFVVQARRDERREEKKAKESPAKPQPPSSSAQKEIDKAEKNIAKLTLEKENLELLMADPATYTDMEKMRAAQKKHSDICDKLTVLEKFWLEKAV